MHSFAYPSVDPGIPTRSVEEFLATQKDIIDRIKICYGVDRLTFEQELSHSFAAIRNSYICCKRRRTITSTSGGLLRMGLEVAFSVYKEQMVIFFPADRQSPFGVIWNHAGGTRRSSPDCAAKSIALSAT
jgi:hypothetical protein